MHDRVRAAGGAAAPGPAGAASRARQCGRSRSPSRAACSARLTTARRATRARAGSRARVSAPRTSSSWPMHRPAAPTGAAAANPIGTSGSAAAAYELTGSNEGQVAAFVGKRVEITGTLKPAEVSASGQPTGGATAGQPPSGVDVASKDLKLRELEVTSVREATGTCPARSRSTRASACVACEATTPMPPLASLRSPPFGPSFPSAGLTIPPIRLRRVSLSRGRVPVHAACADKR